MDQSRKCCRQTYGDTIGQRGMQRDEVTGQQCPYDGSDVTGEKSGNGSKQVTDYNDDESKCSEVNSTRNKRDRAKISPKYTGEYTEYYEENNVNK